MAEHVDVTLLAGGHRADLRIPTRVTVHRLVGELAEIVPGLADGLPAYRLRVRTRGVLLTENDVVGTGVVHGAVLELVRGRTDG